jgi:hypothetical protein
MVRSIQLLAVAALAAGLAAATPAAHAQAGPQDEGAVQTTGPLGAPPQKAKPRQAALKKRARQAKQAPAGRQITVHARPSYLTLGTQAPVGTVGNGYVYSTFNQPTPIEGTFQGMRGRERITDPLGNASPGLTLFRF